MSIYLEAARAILSIPVGRGSWNNFIVLDENHDVFFWTDAVQDGLADLWNDRFAGNDTGLPMVTDSGEYPKCCFHYKGKSVEIPFTECRDDDSIMIHSLNQAVRDDSEFRFCIDSACSSNLAYLALPTKEWEALEAELGRDQVNYRFLTLPEKVDDLIAALDYEERNTRNYEADEETPSDTDLFIARIESDLRKLGQGRLNDARVKVEVLDANRVTITVMAGTKDESLKIREDKEIKLYINSLNSALKERGLKLHRFTVLPLKW